jgi:hypothetical protein
MADYQGSTTNIEFRDLSQTPRWLYEALNAEFNFCLDAAALPETALHTNYLTPEIDALKVSWGGIYQAISEHRSFGLTHPTPISALG